MAEISADLRKTRFLTLLRFQFRSYFWTLRLHLFFNRFLNPLRSPYIIIFLTLQSFYLRLEPISGRVDRASATEAVDTGSIPGRVKPKTIKIGIHSFPLDVQQLKGQCEASIVCGRQMGRWQLDSKTERSFRCLLAKATW